MDVRPAMYSRTCISALLALTFISASLVAVHAQRVPDEIVQLYDEVRIATELEEIQSVAARLAGLPRLQMALGRGIGGELAAMFQQREDITAEVALAEAEVVDAGAFVRANWTYTGTTTETGEPWEATQQRADMLVLQDGIWQFLASDLVDLEAMETKVDGQAYTDPANGLSVTAPEGWRLIPFVAPGTKAAVAAWAPDLTGWGTWVVADVPGQYTAEQLARSEMETLEKLGEQLGTSSRDPEAGETTLAGQPAFRTSRTIITEDGTEVYALRTYCIVGNLLYLFAPSAVPPDAYETHKDAFMAALESTRITAPEVVDLPPEMGRVEDGTYINDVHGCKITAPEGWDTRIGEGEGEFQVSMNQPDGKSFMVLGMVKLPTAELTARQAVEQANAVTPQLTENWELIESGEITVGVLPAHQSVSRFDVAGNRQQRKRVYLVDNQRLFYIIGDAIPADEWDSVKGAFDKAIQSLELFEAQPVE